MKSVSLHVGRLLRGLVVLGIIATQVLLPRPAAADPTRCPVVADSWMGPSSPNANHGTENPLLTSPVTRPGGGDRALFLAALDGVPAGANILSASFNVYQSSKAPNQTMTLYRLTEPWTERGATWSRRDGTASWATAGGTYDNAPLGSFSATDKGWKTVDVTSLVRAWMTGAQPNYGFLLIADPGKTKTPKFNSREAAEARRPYLSVTYDLSTPTSTPVITATPTNTPTPTATPAPNHPAVNAVALYRADRVTGVTAMDPQAEYALKVTVSDLDTLADLVTVKVTIFHDADADDNPAGVPLVGDTWSAAVLTCTVDDPPVWSIDPAVDSTWQLLAPNSVQPDLNGTIGDFWFHFRPGKVATQAEDWDVYAVADDGGGSPGAFYDGSDYDMNWYGEIAINTASVDWGTVSLGSDFDANGRTGLVASYISNGNYVQQVRADGAWTSAGPPILLNAAGAPGDGEFSLMADDTADRALAVLLSTEYAYFDAGSQTSEWGNVEGDNTVWLKLGPAAIPAVTYSGTLYYRIAP